MFRLWQLTALRKWGRVKCLLWCGDDNRLHPAKALALLIFGRPAWFLAVIGVGFMGVEFAQACVDQAQSELETVFCQIKRQDPSVNLPSLHDFRRNSPKVQYFLIKRPAAQLGLTVPKESTAKKAASMDKNPLQADGVDRTDSVQSKPVATDKQKKARASSATKFDECQFQKDNLVCPNSVYQLQKNNNRGVDISITQLLLGPPPKGGTVEEQNIYLHRSYEQYIEGMVNAGLAEVTMSYTKFHHVYDEVRQAKGDFAQRMATMFEFLIKDKRAMGVPSRSDKRLPGDPSLCHQLNKRIIVCDNVADNWVYSKKD